MTDVRLFLLAAVSGGALLTVGTGNLAAQRGQSGPPEHAKVTPVNNLPNPYETVRNWGIAAHRTHMGIGQRRPRRRRRQAHLGRGSLRHQLVRRFDGGSDRQAGSAAARSSQSFGAGQIIWPHGMDVDRQGNVWIADARVAPAPMNSNKFPNAAGKGHTVTKFSPQGKVLLVLGTPGEAGNPPTHFTEPNDVLVAPDGSIFVAEAHNAQFLDKPETRRRSAASPSSRPTASSSRAGARGATGPSEFRGPHSLAMDSQGPAVRRRPRQPPHPDLRPGRQASRHLVSVQPHQRALHRSRTTSSTRSTRSRTTTTTRAGGKAFASATPRPARCGISCRSTFQSSRRAWAATDRWAKAWRWTAPATSTPARSDRSRGSRNSSPG